LRKRLAAEVIEIVLDFVVRAVPGIEVSIDAAVLESAGSPTHELALRLRDEGVTVWIEALALAGRDEHWRGFNQWCLDRELRRYASHNQSLMPLGAMGETVIAYTSHDGGSSIDGDAFLSRLVAAREPGVGRAWQPWDHLEFTRLLGTADAADHV